MTLLIFEGFDSLQSASPGSDLNGQPGWAWGGNQNTKIAGLINGFGLQCNGATGGMTVQYNTGVANTTLICGVRYRTTESFPSIAFMSFLDSAGAVQCGLAINAAGRLIAFRGTTATVLGTGTAAFVSGTWRMVECKATINSSTGSMVVYVDGVPDISVAGANTAATANINTQYVRLNVSGSNTSAFDDFYLCDGVGSAPYNDILGTPRVETLYPTSNDAVAWTPNASTNVSQVLEVAFDGGTTFNKTSVAAVDTFNHGALSVTPTTIFGVIVKTEFTKDDTTAQQVRNKLKSGATTSNGVTFNPLAGAYQASVDLFVNDPNTAAAWTAANVNATKHGYEKF